MGPIDEPAPGARVEGLSSMRRALSLLSVFFVLILSMPVLARPYLLSNGGHHLLPKVVPFFR